MGSRRRRSAPDAQRKDVGRLSGSSNLYGTSRRLDIGRATPFAPVGSHDVSDAGRGPWEDSAAVNTSASLPPGLEASDPSDLTQRPLALGGTAEEVLPAWLTPELRDGLPQGRFRSQGVELDFSAFLLAAPGLEVSIPVADRAPQLVLASCCAPAAAEDWDVLTDDLRHEREVAAVGEPVADLEIRYADGTAPVTATLRRRFETAPARVWFGFLPYSARCHRMDRVAPEWQDGAANGQQTPAMWLTAIANPYPDRMISEVGLRSRATAVIAAGLTLWQRDAPPLAAREELHVAVDGVVDVADIALRDATLLRAYQVDLPDPATWLRSGIPGFGGERLPIERTVIELAGTAETVVTVRGAKFSIGDLPAAAAAIERDGVVARLLPEPSLRMRIGPVADGRPASGRVHLRAADGRQLQPVDRARFLVDLGNVDQGTDVLRRGWRYAYVEGEFEVDAPPGDVYVEFVKGPAHEVARRILDTEAGAVVELPIRRIADPRAEGWLASDTHVHYLDPMAAHRQARAEGLELVHLMSAQWGDLVTNVMDLAEGPVVASDEAVVWVGTENRHHILGHFLAVGTPNVRPLSSGGPNTSTIGDPTRITVADWADATRAGGGLAIFPHFPYPDLESVADLLCGRLDAVEVLFDPLLDGRRLREWYRYLDLGLRIPLMTGTDKMGPFGILGEIRTYTYTGAPAIDFETWAAAVRAGRTVVSVGTLLDFRIDGLLPGATIGPGATRHCTWTITSAYPLDALEIVANGAVVHREALGDPGTFEGSLDLELPERGWVAARCAGPVISELGGPGGIFEGLQVGAHSSPHYRPDPVPAHPAELRHLRTRVEGGLAWGARLAKWVSPDAQARFEQLMTDALGVLDRMQAPGD
jgi:hypothetical protein